MTKVNEGALPTTKTDIAYSGDVETYLVTTSGYYDIVAEGAEGGAGATPTEVGGLGAMASGEIYLQAGVHLEIVVGGKGGFRGSGGGGGGGSFVFETNGAGGVVQPEVIAGGGGGAGFISPGGDAQLGPTGGNGGGFSGGKGGVDGAPGQGASSTSGGGGGGYTGGAAGGVVAGVGHEGQKGYQNATSFSGGAGGSMTGGAGGDIFLGGDGGFGGGGGADMGGGGGGGFGGGGGGGGAISAGGGGGSYVNTSAVKGSASTSVLSSGDAAANGGNGLVFIDYAPCYCPGSLILTDGGEVAVEALRIGDRVVTAGGEIRPIKWIGTRAYSARFARNNFDAHPICFKAGSLARDTPHSDLWVSPKHAMFLDGVLIPAERLVNGATITQPLPSDEVRYVHIELDSHDVLIANGAESESFVDDDSRALFHNAASYAALYAGEARRAARFCAPRVEDGHALERVRRRLAERAGLPVPPQINLGALEGEIESLDATCVEGWARSAAFPDAPVCLDVRAGAEFLGYAYADRPRVGGGRAFALRFETPLEAAQLRQLEVTRSADGAVLARRVGPFAA